MILIDRGTLLCYASSMNKKSPQAETILGICFIIIGIIFLIQGFKLVGIARITFIACGIIDFVIAYLKLKHLWVKK